VYPALLANAKGVISLGRKNSGWGDCIEIPGVEWAQLAFDIVQRPECDSGKEQSRYSLTQAEECHCVTS
jgi:hypothetical protein